MKTRTPLISALLLTSSLMAPAALAQTIPADEPVVQPEAVEPDTTEDDQGVDVDVSAPGGEFTGEIIVRGRFIPNPIRATPEVVSVLGTEEIARTADGDIAGSLQRVTGLSVVGGRFVFVRGLGERYSLALLNGLPLPSPEPLRRVVPLDLFPTSVIASTVVQKSYSANYPGEFGGGVINLTTKTAPAEPFLEIDFGVSGDTETTGKLGYTYFGSNTDFLGYDSGERDIPQGLANAIAQNIPISVGTDFSSEDLKGFATSLSNSRTNLIQRNRDIPANFSGGITGGTSFDVGDILVGVIANAGIDNSWRTRGGVQQKARGIRNVDGEDGLLADENFRYVSTQNRVVVNGLLGVSAEFDESQIRFTNLYIHDTVKDAQISQGIDSLNVDEETLLNTGRTSFFERQLFTSQLVGELRFDDWSVDFRGAYSKSQRDAPYERTYSYAFDDQIANDFVNDLTSPGQSARVRFSELDDVVYGGGLDLGYNTVVADLPIKFTVGYNYYKNERDAQRRDFRFVPAGNIPNPIDQERIDFLLSDYNIVTYDIQLREVASVNSVPRYEAELEVHAGYGQVEVELADALRLNVGVRYEDGKQSVTPILLTGLGGGAAATATNISNDYWLPAGTLTWNFTDDMQFRLAASKTIARPQFRELAQQQFLDLETDRTFVGNPLLVDSTLVNFEGRFEYYMGRGERVTIAGFYKKIDDPIDTVAFFQGDTLFQGFSNAPEATLYGAEVELVKYFDLYDLGGLFEDRRLMIAANYTYTKSDIKVGADDVSVNPITLAPVASTNLFDDGDALAGQSDHVANVQIGFERDKEERLSQQTILLSYNSPRVTARGPQQQPDLIERNGWQLDVVLREAINIAGQDFELKFEARNILGEDYRESQVLNNTTILNNTYDVGTRFAATIGLRF